MTFPAEHGHNKRWGNLHLLPQQSWYVLRVLLILAPVPQILALLWLIWRRTAAVPAFDEWATVDLVHRLDQGMLGWTDLWALHNEHRIVIPRILDLILIKVTGWNRQIEMTADLALGIGTMVLLLSCVRRTGDTAKLMVVAIFPFSLCLLSLGEYANWQSPFQVAFLATVFGVALCLWAFTTQTRTWLGLTLAILGALVASLSSFAGLMTWVIFLPNLWNAGYRSAKFLGLWSATGIITIALYMRGLSPSLQHAILPLDVLKYALAYLGSPVGYPDVVPSQLAAIASMMFLSVNLAAYWSLRRSLRHIAVWVSLALFAAACAAITALGRGGQWGIAEALESRYQAFSALWWVAVIAVTLLVISEVMERSHTSRDRPLHSLRYAIVGVNAVCLVTVCLALIQVNLVGLKIGNTWLSLQQHNQNCIVNYDTAADSCLNVYYPGGSQIVRRDAAYLEQSNLAVFRTAHRLRIHDLPQLPGTPLCSIDVINTITAPPNRIGVILGQPLSVSGWAVDARSKSSAAAVLVSLDGTQDFLADSGDARPDVAKQYANNAYGRAGFHVLIPGNKLSAGEHSLTIKVVSHNADSYSELSQGRSISVSVRPLSELKRAQGTTAFFIDSLAGVGVMAPGPVPIVLPQMAPILMSGWAVDSQAGTRASGVYLSVDGTMDIPITYGNNRPDVAAVLGNPAYVASGFYTIIPAGTLPVGAHRLTIKIMDHAGESYYEPPWTVTVEIRT